MLHDFFLAMCFTWEVLKHLQPESLADASAFRAALRGSNMPAEKASIFEIFLGSSHCTKQFCKIFGEDIAEWIASFL